MGKGLGEFEELPEGLIGSRKYNRLSKTVRTKKDPTSEVVKKGLLGAVLGVGAGGNAGVLKAGLTRKTGEDIADKMSKSQNKGIKMGASIGALGLGTFGAYRAKKHNDTLEAYKEVKTAFDIVEESFNKIAIKV